MWVQISSPNPTQYQTDPTQPTIFWTNKTQTNPSNSGPCNSVNYLGHSKMLADDDDETACIYKVGDKFGQNQYVSF